MRIIKKTLAILIGLMLTVWLVLQLPFILIFELHKHIVKCKKNLFIELMGSVNNYLIELVSLLWRKKELELVSETVIKKEMTQKLDPRPETLKMLPIQLQVAKNIFENRSTVFYYEGMDEPLVKQQIKKHYEKIYSSLDAKEIDFIFPHLFNDAVEADFEKLTEYYFPIINTDNTANNQVRKHLSNPKFFKELIGFEEIHGACFIRSTKQALGQGYEYRVYHLPTIDAKNIDDSIEFYLLSVPSAVKIDSQPQFQYSTSRSAKQLKDDEPDGIFSTEDMAISSRLQTEIEKELKLNSSNGAIKMMLFMLKKMREFNIPTDSSMRTLIADLRDANVDAPSSILITSTGKIILKEFKKEIELTPLQKTVFIFFLLKQDGIMFKDLPKYKNELFNIYSKISNRTSMQTIQKSVAELANPYSNSMSEKCSRIREAFMKCMDERLANHYCITGARNNPKRIELDRSLVEFEDAIY
jgi:hypothetical protein